MDKVLQEQLNNLKLTSEERKLIDKINKNLSSLQQETIKFINKDDDFLEANDLKTIFFDDTGNDSLLSKYHEILDELKNGIEKIQIRKKEEVKDNKVQLKLEMPEKTYQIVNTIQNLERLFLKATKNEAVSKITELDKIINNDKKKNYYKQKIESLIGELEIVIEEKNFIEISSLERDLEFIKNIETKKFKKHFNLMEIILFTTMYLLTITFFVLGVISLLYN